MVNIKYKILQTMDKGTNIFSEMASFFKKSGKISAFNAISGVMKNVKLNLRPLGFEKPRHNCLYPTLCVLQLLLMFPSFSVANPANYTTSPLFKLVSCHKDVFYDFLNNGRTKWRKIMYYINCQLWAKITVRSDHKKRDLPVVLIFDDTDIIKASSAIEMVSKIFSHVTNSSHWGYKGLFCCLSDGISQLLMDFSLCREYKEADFGLNRRQAARQYKSADDEDAEIASRKKECVMSKIELMKEMIKRCVKTAYTSNTFSATVGSRARDCQFCQRAAWQALPGHDKDVKDKVRLRKGPVHCQHPGIKALEDGRKAPQDVRIHIYDSRRDTRWQTSPSVLLT